MNQKLRLILGGCLLALLGLAAMLPLSLMIGDRGDDLAVRNLCAYPVTVHGPALGPNGDEVDEIYGTVMTKDTQVYSSKAGWRGGYFGKIALRDAKGDLLGTPDKKGHNVKHLEHRWIVTVGP